jgi:hypothetical protein
MKAFSEKFVKSLLSELVNSTHEVCTSVGLNPDDVSLCEGEISIALSEADFDLSVLKSRRATNLVSSGKVAAILANRLCRARFLTIENNKMAGKTGRLECLIVLMMLFDCLLGVRPEPRVVSEIIYLIERRYYNAQSLGLLFEVLASQSAAHDAEVYKETIR